MTARSSAALPRDWAFQILAILILTLNLTAGTVVGGHTALSMS